MTSFFKTTGMKIMLLVFLSASLNCFSQDLIELTTGDSIIATVIEVGVEDISYKINDSIDAGPIYKILKSDISYILYKSGRRDIFEDSISEDELYEKGIEDAKHFYTGYKGAATTTLITSIIYPLVGLAPAIICSAVPPNEKTLGFPDEKLIYNPPYRYGYIQKAKKMKLSRVWINWLIPTATWAAIIASIVLLLQSIY